MPHASDLPFSNSHDCCENSVLLAIVPHHKQNLLFTLGADLVSRTVPFALLSVLPWKGSSPPMTSLWKAKLWCMAEHKVSTKDKELVKLISKTHHCLTKSTAELTNDFKMQVQTDNGRIPLHTWKINGCYLLILSFPLHLLTGCF